MAAATLVPAAAPAAQTTARSSSRAVLAVKTFPAPWGVSHFAVHWTGSHSARVRIETSSDGRRFGRARAVQLDDLGEASHARETYGAVTLAYGVRAIRLYTDRPLRRLTVLWLTDLGRPVRPGVTAAAFAQPKVTPRVDWGADESLRFDAAGKEVWPPAFYPVQKLIVHHTATQNGDPDPAATVRSIYYYHAVTQAWGDIATTSSSTRPAASTRGATP